MAQENDTQGGGEVREIEASGDAIIIADAIYGGLAEIAAGLRAIAKALEGEEGEPQEEEYYLDGTKK